jgi:hypothetical protein
LPTIAWRVRAAHNRETRSYDGPVTNEPDCPGLPPWKTAEAGARGSWLVVLATGLLGTVALDSGQRSRMQKRRSSANESVRYSSAEDALAFGKLSRFRRDVSLVRDLAEVICQRRLLIHGVLQPIGIALPMNGLYCNRGDPQPTRGLPSIRRTYFPQRVVFEKDNSPFLLFVAQPMFLVGLGIGSLGSAHDFSFTSEEGIAKPPVNLNRKVWGATGAILHDPRKRSQDRILLQLGGLVFLTQPSHVEFRGLPPWRHRLRPTAVVRDRGFGICDFHLAELERGGTLYFSVSIQRLFSERFDLQPNTHYRLHFC